MTSMKFLFIFALWTLLLDLDHVAAATYSTRRSVTRSDHEYGMQPEIDVDADLDSIGLQDEEIEENGGQVFELHKVQLHPRHEVVQKKNTPEFSGGAHHHVEDKRMYAISVTNHEEVVDIGESESDHAIISTELDRHRRPVAIKSSTRSSSKHIVDPEADMNVILQPAVEFMLESNEGLDTNDDAGHTTQLQKQKKPRSQQLENVHTDVASKSDTHYHESAEKKASPAASRKGRINSHGAINRPSRSEGAGHKNNDAEEVVLIEERDEDKKLIPDYNLGEPIKDWNQKRQEWAREHPEVKQEQLFILTGTQPSPCTNPNGEGDHLLLRCFKNKVDYSRIHGVGLFYNTALLDAHMPTFWAKLPVVRATMLAHPEVEWIWWLDADAIITDMEFSIPLHRYSAYNLVVHGWESLIFEKRSWLGLNAGSFLLRNCQWSLELLERWASMGPKAPMGDAYRHILSDFLPDRPRNPTDDQAALVFLLIKERQRWAGKLRVELDYFLSGYWLELMDGFEATEERYRAMEEQHAELWKLLERQGAVGKEKLVTGVGRAREQHLSASGTSVQQRRPFITHFTGCQPCSGHHNNIYSTEQCHTGLLRALNYADDQVLRTLGYHHRALHLPHVLPAQSAIL